MNRTLVLLSAGLLTIGLGATLPQTAAAGGHGDHHGYPSSLLGVYFYDRGHHSHREHWCRPHGHHSGHRSRGRNRHGHGGHDRGRGRGGRGRHEDW